MPLETRGLPIEAYIEDIKGALAEGHLVLRAETGAGKTTVLQAALARDRKRNGKIIVLEPRRLAAVGAAQRCAELLGEAPGRTIGYRVRGDSRTGPLTRLEFVTEAVFLRMIQDDPFMEGHSLVVFDEFHERSARGDLSLAFAAEAAELREGLSLLVMSATLDTGDIAAYLECPVMDIPGRSFPVSVRYARERGDGLLSPCEEAASQAAELFRSCGGSVLVFLPGQRELRDAEAELRRADAAIPSRLLYGSMPLAEQKAILAADTRGTPSVILATSVAETSLTVPGVRAVVDAGLSRFSRYHARSGMNALVTERVSLAEAWQRAGRAGRLAPGTCVRCWAREDRLREARDPELLRTELSEIVLECALRGSVERGGVRWLTEPPARSWEAGVELLGILGLVSAGGALTERGRRAAALGTDTRAAASLISAAMGPNPDEVHLAALAAAALAEGSPGGRGDEPFLQHLETLARGFKHAGKHGPVPEADRLCRRALGTGFDPSAALGQLERAGEILAPGFADRLARRTEDGSWEFRSGKRARHGAGLPERGWIAAFDCDSSGALATIYRSVPVSEEAALATLGASAETVLRCEWKDLRLRAFERVMSGAFALKERQLAALPPDAVAAAVRGRIAAEGTGWLPWGDSSRSLLARARYAARMGRLAGAPPVLLPEEKLATMLEAALPPYIPSSGQGIGEEELCSCLRDLLALELGPGAAAALDREAPAAILTPGGRRRAPCYPEQGEARLSMRIQEAFGMTESPLICGVPLVLELLSPADRPLQLTKDLASFWRTAYPELRRELSRRYPRHHWPEDPLSAAPGKGLKPRA